MCSSQIWCLIDNLGSVWLSSEIFCHENKAVGQIYMNLVTNTEYERSRSFATWLETSNKLVPKVGGNWSCQAKLIIRGNFLINALESHGIAIHVISIKGACFAARTRRDDALCERDGFLKLLIPNLPLAMNQIAKSVAHVSWIDVSHFRTLRVYERTSYTKHFYILAD